MKRVATLPQTPHPALATHPLKVTRHPLRVTRHPAKITHHPHKVTHHPRRVTRHPQRVIQWRISLHRLMVSNPDSKVYGANMGPIWGRQDPGGPHVGPMNFATWDHIETLSALLAIFVKDIRRRLVGFQCNEP